LKSAEICEKTFHADRRRSVIADRRRGDQRKSAREKKDFTQIVADEIREKSAREKKDFTQMVADELSRRGAEEISENQRENKEFTQMVEDG
jgi:hypothetical protein